MSLSLDGQWITCDNEGCHSRARMPIGLLNGPGKGAGVASPVAGWLFVSRGDSTKHYCSNCRSIYLNQINTPLSASIIDSTTTPPAGESG